MSWVNDGPVRERGVRGENFIYCFWHNRLLLMPYVHGRMRMRKNLCAMASRSKDGQLISDVLKGFGIAVARGSSSRGGETAMMEMAALLREGWDAAVTPDGPRGPIYRVQPGVVLLAQRSGVPIVPASYEAKYKVRLKSWDRFIIPLPFSPSAVVFGDPICVGAGADAGEREKIRRELEKTMREMDARAASVVGVPCS